MSIIDNLYDYMFIKNLREYGHNLNELGNTYTVTNCQKVLFLLMDQALDIKFYI